MSSGLLDLLGSTPDAPGATPLDPGTQGIVNRMTDKAGGDASTFTAGLNQGAGSNLMENKQQALQSDARQGGGMGASDFGAIRNAYAGQANRQINQIQQKNDMQGKMMKADYMNTTAKALLGQQQQAVNQYGVLTNAYIQQEQARAGFISSLFQVGNTAMAASAATQKSGTAPSKAGGYSMPSVGSDYASDGIGSAAQNGLGTYTY